MKVLELTDLRVTDLLGEYKRSFRDYWQMHDEAVAEFRRRFIEASLRGRA